MILCDYIAWDTHNIAEPPYLSIYDQCVDHKTCEKLRRQTGYLVKWHDICDFIRAKHSLSLVYSDEASGSDVTIQGPASA